MFAKAQAMLVGLPAGPDTLLWRVDYGSYRRDAAAVLALALEAGSDVIDPEDLSLRLARAGQEVSTQEAAWTLLAANGLIRDLATAGITVDGAPAEGPVVQVRADDAVLPDLSVGNGGDAATDLTVTVIGVPVDPPKAGGNGYAIARDYYTLDGDIADLSALTAGTRLVAVLTIRPLGTREGRLMVNDPLPAGFEIDNPNLLRGGDISALAWLDLREPTHAEFRQDRFLAAVDHFGQQPFMLAYIVRAVSPGQFHHPAALVEDMYRPQFRAVTASGRITVAE
jgi:alpha-2-macroglobulin